MRLACPLPRLVRRAGIRFRWQEITLKADMELPGAVRAAPRGDGTAALPEAPGPHALPPGCQMPPTPTLHPPPLPAATLGLLALQEREPQALCGAGAQP